MHAIQRRYNSCKANQTQETSTTTIRTETIVSYRADRAANLHLRTDLVSLPDYRFPGPALSMVHHVHFYGGNGEIGLNFHS